MRIDFTGKKFYRLAALSFSHKDDSNKSYWNFICDCGNKLTAQTYDVSSGHTKSCGCLKSELTARRSTTHGLTPRNNHHPLYSVWANMKVRCKNKNNNNYGGRGIKVLWKSFEEFQKDMGESYKEHLEKFGKKNTTLDRIDTNGNYEKSNCRWATAKEQSRNVRYNKLLTFKKKTYCAKEWSEKIGLPYQTLMARLTAGWDIPRTLTEPLNYD